MAIGLNLPAMQTQYGDKSLTVEPLVTAAALSSDFTFTRSTPGGAWVDGTYTEFAIDAPRFGRYDIHSTRDGLVLETRARTNSIRNSTMVGASAAPSTFPTNWVSDTTGGLTAAIVGTGTEYGLNYVDLRWNGTATGTYMLTTFEGNTQVAALASQHWASSVYCRIVDGSAANINDFNLSIVERDSGGGFEIQEIDTFVPSSGIQRFVNRRTLTDVDTAYINTYLGIVFDVSAVIDITLRIYAPQLERVIYPGGGASVFIPTTTAAVTRAAEVCDIVDLAGTQWYNQVYGTFTGAVQKADASIGTYARFFECADDDGSDILAIHYTNADEANIVGSIKAATVQVVNSQVNDANADAVKFVGLAYEEDNTVLGVDGVNATTDESCTMPTVSTLVLGEQGPSFQQTFYGTILALDYRPVRVSEAELQQLTAWQEPAYEDLVTATALHEDATFTRATVASCFVDDVFTEFAIDTPRFGTLSGEESALAGLIIEGARTNLNPYSNPVSTGWSNNSGATRNANALLAIDGTMTAMQLNMEASGVSGIYKNPSMAVTDETTYTVSAYMRGVSGTRKVRFGSDSSSAWGSSSAFLATFDLVAETFSSVGASVDDYGFESLPGGWYRVWLTGDTVTSVTATSLVFYNGDASGVSAIGLDGVQFEAGAGKSSLIKTVGSAVARSADVCSVINVTAKSWYNHYQGTFVSEVSGTELTESHNIVSLNDGSGNNRVVAKWNTAGAFRLLAVSATTTVSNLGNRTWDGTPAKVAVSFKEDLYSIAVDGQAVETDTAGDYPVGLDTLEIGADTGVQHLDGVIISLKYYPEKVINTKLVELSA